MSVARDHVHGRGLDEVLFAAGDLDVAVVVARYLATIDGVAGHRRASLGADTGVSPGVTVRQTEGVVDVTGVGGPGEPTQLGDLVPG